MGQPHASCCGAKSGQSSVVSIDDPQGQPYHPSYSRGGEDLDGPGLDGFDAVPAWLSDLAPRLAGEQAAQAAKAWVLCAEELQKRTRGFIRRSLTGVPCRLIDSEYRQATPAMYSIDEACTTLTVEALVPTACSAAHPPRQLAHPNSSGGCSEHDNGWNPPVASARTMPAVQGLVGDDASLMHPFVARASGGPALGSSLAGPKIHAKPTPAPMPPQVAVKLADVRNVWVCADSELARRAHGSLKHGALEADLSCVMLIDAPSRPIGLVERSAEAREEFLDCLAVLIATQRWRHEPELARCKGAKGAPPPEAKLRPSGRSLQSAHLSGPICQWLAEEVGKHSLPAMMADAGVAHRAAISELAGPLRPEAGAGGEAGMPLLLSRPIEARQPDKTQPLNRSRLQPPKFGEGEEQVAQFAPASRVLGQAGGADSSAGHGNQDLVPRAAPGDGDGGAGGAQASRPPLASCP